jgi:hypothetical protein
MMSIPAFKLPDIVPHDEVRAWQQSLYAEEKKKTPSCPEEVLAFIESVSEKLPDFEQYQKEVVRISGVELMLCNIHEQKGESIKAWVTYPLPIPKMQAVAYKASMMSIFRKKGKQGLIDFVRARVKKTAIEQTLSILNVYVFHQSRPEFQKMLSEIRSSNKLEPVLP